MFIVLIKSILFFIIDLEYKTICYFDVIQLINLNSYINNLQMANESKNEVEVSQPTLEMQLSAKQLEIEVLLLLSK